MGPLRFRPASSLSGMAMAKTVYIQTYCEHPALAYGALLVFKTIRVGFPTSRVVVMDNGSHPEVLGQIKSECDRVGAEFNSLKRRNFLDFFANILKAGGKDVAIVDPDVVFWGNVEDWEFDALIAGRKIPDLVRYGVKSVARLHPSMVFIPDVEKLVAEIGVRWINKLNCLGQYSAHLNGEKLFWDTLAPIYQAMPELCHEFTPEELDHYDHLFYGSHLPAIAPGLKETFTERAHWDAASGRIEALKGIWRKQEEDFAKPDHCASLPVDAVQKMVDSCKTLGMIQGVNDGYEDAVNGLVKGLV